MRILHVITVAELGGAQSVVLNLAASASKEGHEVGIASAASGLFWDVIREPIKKFPIDLLDRAIDLKKDYQVVKALRQLDKEYRPDVVHLHSSKIGILGRIAFAKSRIIYTVHGFDSIRIAHRRFILLERLLQNRARFLVSVSEYDKSNLLKEKITHNVVSIPNGIIDYSGQSADLADIPEVLARIERHRRQINIICIARMTPPKRFDLFKELAGLCADLPFAFFWVGNQLEVADLPANLCCLGEVSAAHRLLRLMDASVLCSDFEGMPMSILESLCYGLPVVASDVGGIREVLNGTNGYVVPNAAVNFKDALMRIVDSEEHYRAFSLAARNSYLKQFSVAKMYEGYRTLYQQIFKENNPPGQ